jgi:glycosyltransferase involved in cell wall biosynthesis
MAGSTIIEKGSMPKTRVLCVLSNLLGNRATTAHLLDALRRIDNLDATVVTLDAEDYTRFPAPLWARATNPWHAQYIARRKTRPLLDRRWDILLINSWENVTTFRSIARRTPAAALFDAVPVTVDAQVRARTGGGWKRRLAHAVHSSSFSRAVREFDYFLPMGSDCEDALVEHYGVPRERCFVTLAPQDLNLWTPAPKTPSPTLRLLFVANDFERKGGEFLLDLYARYLRDSCRLTIASNNPALAGRSLPEGVDLLRGKGREELLQVYRRSDLFVFPSGQDYMPQVIAEALAVGVPCMANDVGAIRDLVRTGETGFLMSRSDSPELWAKQIAALNADREELARLSIGARRFAEERLGLPRFQDLIAKIMARLRRIQKLKPTGC